MSQPPPAPRWSLRGVADAALWVGILGAFGLCLLTIAAFAGERHWLLELTTHFRPHYTIALLVCALVWTSVRRFRTAAIFAAFAMLNTSALLPRFAAHANPPSDAPHIKLLLSNVHTGNQNHQAILALIKSEQPDIVALLEINDAWLDALKPLTLTHPHTRSVSRPDNFGIALFSRLPLSNAITLYLSPAEVPSIHATIPLKSGGHINLLATHPLPPGDAEGLLLRDQQISAIARWSSTSLHPAIVLGDLNCAPWSPAFRRLLKEGSLIDTGHGVTPTWPVKPWFLRIPLDHCLISPSLFVADHQVGPDIGSDHFPIIVTVAVP